jgi:hypothetical protein
MTRKGNKRKNGQKEENKGQRRRGTEEYLLLGYDALHGVTSQKKILFKTTAVKTSSYKKRNCMRKSKDLRL